jgi:RHS repeat-associated protein
MIPASIKKRFVFDKKALSFTLPKNRHTDSNRDREIGLYYVNFRWYDPSTMRFISKDPAPIDVNDPRTINKYTFVNNNPLRFVDPDGRLSLSILRDTTNFLLKPLHYARNMFQEGKIPTDENGAISEANLSGAGWVEQSMDDNIFHIQDGAIDNVKYLGPEGNMEIILNKKTNVVETNPLNAHSYNFVNPKVMFGAPHITTDVMPYVLWGNTANDPSTISQRLDLSAIGLKTKLESVFDIK